VTAAAIEPEPVPLTRDAAGRLIVIGTRAPLDTLVAAFEPSDSPEAIHESCPTVSLGDIYAIFTYCVRHRDDVNDYLARHDGRRQRRVDRPHRRPNQAPRSRHAAHQYIRPAEAMMTTTSRDLGL
jgi:uncharacterized protein (DUF433 family)